MPIFDFSEVHGRTERSRRSSHLHGTSLLRGGVLVAGGDEALAEVFASIDLLVLAASFDAGGHGGEGCLFVGTEEVGHRVALLTALVDDAVHCRLELVVSDAAEEVTNVDHVAVRARRRIDPNAVGIENLQCLHGLLKYESEEVIVSVRPEANVGAARGGLRWIVQNAHGTHGKRRGSVKVVLGQVERKGEDLHELLGKGGNRVEVLVHDRAELGV